ncbi:GyrI-like domain-containing protein [Polaribacter sp. Hel1_33_78]|uniref:GyrI-like domain-containing protein n=1 Tax=Polaribacter sp. Hel1_33_78 TaxID=1336804 RepID=UPI0012FE4C91|nr:GyrI-like domain-containing protein [Polaribacter sp. Hel1_33_78]
MNTNTKVKQSDKLELAYISHKGKMEAIGNVYDRLVKWATPQDLINKETRMLTIYHDSPNYGFKLFTHECLYCAKSCSKS